MVKLRLVLGRRTRVTKMNKVEVVKRVVQALDQRFGNRLSSQNDQRVEGATLSKPNKKNTN